MKVWGDPEFAIDWTADLEAQSAQIARQRAHLGILTLPGIEDLTG